MGLSFEWTFRAGDLLTLIGGITFAAAFLYRRGALDLEVKMTLKILTKELEGMKTELAKFGEILQKVAIQEVQISMLLKWYDELRRGKGLIHEE